MESLYAIQQGALRGDLRGKQGGVPRIQGTCWECGGVGHYSPICPNNKLGKYILLCNNCREEGHKASQCPKPTQARIQPRYVPTLPKDQTAMNWGNKAAAEQPAGDPSSNVRLVQEYEDVRRVSTRRRTYDKTEGKVNQEEPDSDEDSGPVEPKPGTEPVSNPVPVPVTSPVLKPVSLPEVPEPVPDQGENRIPSGVLPPEMARGR